MTCDPPVGGMTVGGTARRARSRTAAWMSECRKWFRRRATNRRALPLDAPVRHAQRDRPVGDAPSDERRRVTVTGAAARGARGADRELEPAQVERVAHGRGRPLA